MGKYSSPLIESRVAKAKAEQWEVVQLNGCGLTDQDLRQFLTEKGIEWCIKLDLHNNRITTLPPEIRRLTNLTVLNLSSNELTVLPPEIGQMTTLTGIILSNNQLTALPPEIKHLTALTILYLVDNQLKAIPPEIGQLTALKELNLFSNKITTIPPEIGQLTALTALHLSDNQLTEIPPEIGQLTALTDLSFFENQITAIPPEILQLTALKELYLFSNRITAIPPEIGRFAALTKLHLSRNMITCIPSEIGQLTKLTELTLSSNLIRGIPPEIAQLTMLTKLTLSSNPLTAIPQEVWQLTKLTELWLSSDHLAVIPPEIGKLTALTELGLPGNHLITIPPEIGQLTALTRLVLAGNQLKTLPLEIGQLKNLTELYLHDNEALGIPPEILGATWADVLINKATPASAQEIINYYQSIQGESGRLLSEFKLIVVGRGGAGKTSLVKRLNNQAFDQNEAETHGITIRKLNFETIKGSVTGRVWDFGGQVVLHSMHEFFLTARSLYLLVLGERDDMLERDATYWLQLIRSYAGNAPVVVALNKSAGRERQFDRATLEKNYGPILAWVPTECSEKDPEIARIIGLRKALTDALDSTHMASMRSKFPREWFTIKDALENMQESYVDHPEYVAMCKTHGVTDSKKQELLAARLHEFGIALNYGRDARLRDTTVLRPDWLANGIYAVLRANDTDPKLPDDLQGPIALDGVINADIMARMHAKAEASNLLRTADYPTDKREFLLRLMSYFHLSYPLDEAGTQQLVPSLLPLQPPEAQANEPQDAERVRLRYEFRVVPAPLLPWFIARSFSMIPDRLHWRRGTMLSFGQATGRVWNEPEADYVYVTVAGPPHDKQRLLSIIRGILKDLFSQYEGLAPVEQWWHKNNWVPRETLEEFGVLPRPTKQLTDNKLNVKNSEVRS